MPEFEGLIPRLLNRPQRRKEEWDQAVKENPDLAPDFAAYNRGLDEYIRTGKFPESRPQEIRSNIGLAQDVPNPSGGVPISVLPDTEVSTQDVPIRRGPASYSFNKRTGRYEEAPSLPPGSNVREFTPQEQSYAIGYDDSGNIVRREPIPGDRDISFKIGTIEAQNDRAEKGRAERAARGTGGRGRGGLTPKEQAWKVAYSKAVAALMPRYDMMGKPISPDVDPALLQAGIEAGQGLGVDTTFLEQFLESSRPEPFPEAPAPEPEKPGLIKKAADFFTGAPKAGAPKADPSSAPVLPRGADAFESDLEKAKTAVSKGLVSREEADRRLKKKYGRGM